jgi:hypothetical protein
MSLSATRISFLNNCDQYGPPYQKKLQFAVISRWTFSLTIEWSRPKAWKILKALGGIEASISTASTVQFPQHKDE